MGQRKSKPSKTSYDVAPVVSAQDFKFENNQNNHETNGNIDNKPPQKPSTNAEPTDITSSSAPTSSNQNNNTNQTEAQRDAAEKTFDPKLIPAWLNAELFVDILKTNLPDFERILEFKAYPALGAGENYATLMLRVSIDAQLTDQSTKNISFMLKVPHDNEQMREMLKVVNFFTMENCMYLDILPEMKQMYKDAGVDVDLSAMAYKFPPCEEENYVLLEDLRPLGFKNANRRDCLDMEHAQWVLKKLAQHHAASATRVAVKGPYDQIFMSNDQLDKDRAFAIWDSMMAQFKDNFLQNIKHYKNGDKYEKQMEACLGSLTKALVALGDYDENEFNALGHGDCWSNNILFKYNDAGEVVDMIFVDYQMCKFDSVAHDLWYFILSSLKLDIKLSKFEYLIRYYYDHLIENLKLLNYPKKLPALREIYMQLYKYGPWTIFTVIVILPVVLLDPNENATMENFMASDEAGAAFKNALFANKRYHDHINEILPWLHERGMLEAYDYSQPKPQHLPSDNTKIEQAQVDIKTTDSVVEQTPSAQVFKTPDWVNETIFIDVLQQHFKDFKSIKDFKTSAATNSGDNYASSMIQVDTVIELLNGETRESSYMLKVALENDQARAMLDMMNTFDKEITMYNEYLPKFEALYKAAGVDLQFAPKSFNFAKNPVENILILENLRPSGYKNADRLNGLDEHHIKAVLTKLAELHAASACYITEHQLPHIIKKSMFSEESRPMFEQMKQLFGTLFFECVNTFEHKTEYFDKVKKVYEMYIDLIIEVAKPDENSFNVLNHGDVWTNNILFKHNESGQIESTYLIDFQIVNYGSPAYDLYYFLMSSPSLNVKLEKFDHHVKFYHDHLVKNLQLLKYPKHIPTLKELHIDLLNRGGFAFATTMGVMSAVLLDPTEQASLANLLSEADAGMAFRKQMYDNKRYRAHADAILQWLNYRGLLDVDIADEKVANNWDDDWMAVPIFEVPTWLNETYFTRVLEEHVEGFDKITNLKAEIATKAGDNYASLVLEINVDAALKDGSQKQLSYILKIPPKGEQAALILDIWNSFRKETELYNKLIPEFESIYKKVGLHIKFAPSHYKLRQHAEGGETVLLENLKPQGFKSANRLEGLNMEQTKSVLRKLAQFHAVSAKFVENGGTYPAYFNESMYNERAREMFEQIMQGTNPTILAAITQYKGHEEYAAEIPNVLEHFLDVAIASNKIDDDEFNVLNHGDCWVNNIMFNYNELGNLNETYLIDFQDCKYGSPAIDLYYFIISSTKLDIKVEQFDRLIKYYHDSLLEHLKLLQFKGLAPSLRELHTSLIKHGHYGVSAILGVTTLCLLDPAENKSFDETDASKEMRTNMYTSPRYRAHAEKVLLWLNRRGGFEL